MSPKFQKKNCLRLIPLEIFIFRRGSTRWRCCSDSSDAGGLPRPVDSSVGVAHELFQSLPQSDLRTNFVSHFGLRTNSFQSLSRSDFRTNSVSQSNLRTNSALQSDLRTSSVCRTLICEKTF